MFALARRLGCYEAVVMFMLLWGGFLAAEERKPIPSAESQQKALELIKEVYGQEWEQAKTPEQKAALAQKLLGKSREATDEVNRFVLLRVAKDVAVQAGDVYIAFRAIDETTNEFEVDRFTAKVSALLEAAKVATISDHHKAIATEARTLIEDAVTEDEFDTAKQLYEVAVAAARSAHEWDLTKQIVTRTKEVEEIANEYSAIRDAIMTLKSHPVDPEANLAVGKYHCFIKGNWEHGLPMLALGYDEKLRELAVTELRGSSDADEQVALGDGWWKVASASEELAKKQLEERAAHWYRKAIPGLSGLDKDKVEKRLTSVDTSEPSEKAEDEWIALFDGRSLKGWKSDQNPHVWSVIDGSIVGCGSADEISHLYYERAFSDFELRAEVKINANGNSGLYFRAWPVRGNVSLLADGYEIQIIGSKSGKSTTGNLIVQARAHPRDLHKIVTATVDVHRDDQWLDLHIIVKDNRITADIDGRQVIAYVDANRLYRAGRIALQQYRADTFVCFRNIRLRLLR